ncbi:MAG: DUF1566 domain-containing protein [Desulfobacterales bacterium]|nr:DUF1566 domain-containing protein [Desulfobacterales bacterium]
MNDFIYDPARERIIDFLDNHRKEVANRKKTNSTSGPKAVRKPKPGKTIREGHIVAYDNGEIIHRLRSEPRELSEEDVMAMLAVHNFFADNLNRSGSFRHDFKDNKDGTITDSVTGLIWEKSGSSESVPFIKAQSYIQGLNQKKFAGFDDWRLPTLEELASLLENKKVDGLFIGPLFDREQKGCWSSDKSSSGKSSSGLAWLVSFCYGSVGRNKLSRNNYVRVVRS